MKIETVYDVLKQVVKYFCIHNTDGLDNGVYKWDMTFTIKGDNLQVDPKKTTIKRIMKEV